MDKLLKWISSLPKWVLVLFGSLFVLVAGYFILFTPDTKANAATVEQAHNAELDIPDPESPRGFASRFDELTRGRDVASEQYWNELQSRQDLVDLPVNGSLDIGLGASGGEVYLDPSVYSSDEIRLIRNGIYTKDEIDARHERERLDRELAKVRNSSSSQPRKLTQEQEDSLYFARLEKALAIVSPASQEAVPAPVPETAPEVEVGESLRHIEVNTPSGPVEATYIRDDDFGNDGIISSLDDDYTGGGIIHYGNGRVKVVPVKATLLKDSRINNGERVTIRIMDDLLLSSGTLIPANTHLMGTANVGRRLGIEITSIHYGGKIYHTNLIAYDNDGTEGIYCPVISKGGKDRAAERATESAVSSATNVFASVLSRSPYVGRVASSAVQQASSALNSDGSKTVIMASGYEFYLMENVEEK